VSPVKTYYFGKFEKKLQVRVTYVYIYVLGIGISVNTLYVKQSQRICLKMSKSRLTQQQEYVLQVIQQHHKTTKVLGFWSHKIHYIDVIVPTRLTWSSPRFIRRVCP